MADYCCSFCWKPLFALHYCTICGKSVLIRWHCSKLDFCIDSSTARNRSYVFISLPFFFYFFQLFLLFVWKFLRIHSRWSLVYLTETILPSTQMLCRKKHQLFNWTRSLFYQLFFLIPNRSRFISFYFLLKYILNRCSWKVLG